MATNTHPDVTLNFGEEHEFQPRKNIRQPVAVFSHLLFRTAAIVTYVFCGWFTDEFIATFVTIVILLSMDFWTVKNVTGRLLVGLRWWNQVDDDGKSHWVYEARKGADSKLIKGAESRIFWLSLVATEVIWAILLFFSLFRFNFKWLMVVIVAMTLNGANLYGYVRCKLGSTDNVKSAATSYISKQMFTSLFQSMMPSKASGTAAQS